MRGKNQFLESHSEQRGIYMFVRPFPQLILCVYKCDHGMEAQVEEGVAAAPT